jgi:hypothetical protein
VARNSPPARPVFADRPPASRSRVGNGAALFLEGTDGRSAAARRFRDVLAEIASDLGGIENLSEAQRQLARRCALLSVECEKMEARAVAGEPIDLDLFGQLVDRLGRALQRIGLRRVPRDVTHLGAYIRQKAGAA